jgi:aminoglycoside phosphotransferase (APT) family kinase protein
MEDQLRIAVERFVAKAADASSVKICSVKLLSGGAIQENWLIETQFTGGPYIGLSSLVLRCDSPTAGISISHNRVQEFALLKVVFDAGVTVPEPLWVCEDNTVIGRQFFIMRCIEGTAAGHILAKDSSFANNRKGLAERLGKELAKIHSIRPPHPQLAFLPLSDEAPARRRVSQYRTFLDSCPTAYPALEWGLRWLERHAPAQSSITLCHGDYRTGNYMVDENGLTGILDWEFAGWSDPMEDIGWFCAKCWRFGNVAAEAGGIGERADFYRGYENESKQIIDPASIKYWEVIAHIKWAIIALQQAERQMSGEEDSLLLALTGHIVPELEWEILNLTEND